MMVVGNFPARVAGRNKYNMVCGGREYIGKKGNERATA